MKGVKVERALPGNILDYYGLLKQAAKEGAFHHPKYSELDLKNDYFNILDDLGRPENIVFLARKGRMILGFISGSLVKRRANGKILVSINMIYVLSKRRKMGIGKQLSSHFFAELSKVGINSFEFICPDSMLEYFSDKWGAKRISNLMVVNNG